MEKTLNNLKLLDEGICPDCDMEMQEENYNYLCQECGKTYDYDWITETLDELDEEGEGEFEDDEMS